MGSLQGWDPINYGLGLGSGTAGDPRRGMRSDRFESQEFGMRNQRYFLKPTDGTGIIPFHQKSLMTDDRQMESATKTGTEKVEDLPLKNSNKDRRLPDRQTRHCGGNIYR